MQIITRPIWLNADEQSIDVIDQRMLPHKLDVLTLKTIAEVTHAIQTMIVRGAPLIGVAAAYGVYLATLKLKGSAFDDAVEKLRKARPTAVNLAWAVDYMLLHLDNALETAKYIEAREIENCRQIGLHGLKIINAIAAKKNGKPVNVLTHCNAGWLACVEWGTATAPIYMAHAAKIPIHVWVDETRPWNQGSRLTAWELMQQKVPCTIIADNTGGHLMQHGLVDIVITGADRVTSQGDVANKVGTYLKALAAHASGVPFYAAMPSSSIDWQISNGLKEIVIEERNPQELLDDAPVGAKALNISFDVTPAKLITGLITEKGIAAANAKALYKLFNND